MTILFWILTYAVIWLIAGFYYLVNGRVKPDKMIVITTPNYETGEVVEKTINSLTGQIYSSITYPICLGDRRNRLMFAAFKAAQEITFDSFKDSKGLC